jgi:hypothetical protein
MASAPAVHSVHIYDRSDALIARLCGIVAASLNVGDAVLIVATGEHRDQLVEELKNVGVNVRVHAREGRFSMFDARETLNTVMNNGMPDADLFMTSIGAMLAEARLKARSKENGLTVFGEMVSVLWDEGKKAAALELEALWNDALNDRAFHLHCAYPRSGFVHECDELAVRQTHSHVIQ